MDLIPHNGISGPAGHALCVEVDEFYVRRLEQMSLRQHGEADL